MNGIRRTLAVLGTVGAMSVLGATAATAAPSGTTSRGFTGTGTGATEAAANSQAYFSAQPAGVGAGYDRGCFEGSHSPFTYPTYYSVVAYATCYEYTP